jgi:hypothetical protein
MILFPALLVGGHLLVAVADRVPDLNFEPICRDGEAQKLGVKDDSAICIKDEKAARDQLAQKWDQFDSADRTRCVRMSTTERTASYVEVLTCLEMNHDARKLRQGEDAGIAAPEPAPGPARESPGPAVRPRPAFLKSSVFRASRTSSRPASRPDDHRGGFSRRPVATIKQSQRPSAFST